MGALKRIMGQVGIDATPFEIGAKKVDSVAANMGKSVGGSIKGMIAGAFTVGAITTAAKETIDFAGKINDMAAQAGVGTEALQEMAYAAEQNGSNLETMVGFLEKVGIARAKALQGDKGAKADFKSMGVSENDLRTKRAEDIGKIIADTVKKGDVQQLIDPLKAVGGKGASALVAAFKDGIEEKGAEARAAGLIISDAVIKDLDDIGDRFDTLGLQMKSTLAPVIVQVAEGIQAMVDQVKRILAFQKGSGGVAGIGKSFGEKLRNNEDGLPGAGKALVDAFKESKAKGDAAVAKVNDDIQKRENELAARRASRERPSVFTSKDDDKAKKEKEPQFQTDKLTTDSLNKMGGFVGGTETAMLSIAKNTLRANEETARNTAALLTAFKNRPKAEGLIPSEE